MIACGPCAHAAAAEREPSASAPLGAFLSQDEIRAATAQLKADPNLGGEKKVRSLRWTGQDSQAPANPPPKWLTGLFEFLGQSTSLVLWVMGALAAAIAAVWIVRTLKARVPAGKVPAAPVISQVRDLDISPESLPDDVGAAALALLDAGRTRAALSLLYRGALSRAVHRHGVPIGESYTEGEALAAVRAKLDAPRAAYFAELVGIWQRAVYAGEAVVPEPVARLCRNFVATLGGAAA